VFQRTWTVLAKIQRKYDSLGKICEEMRCNVKNSLTGNERSETNCDGLSKSVSVISLERNMAIPYGVSAQESRSSSVWMDRQPHRTQISSSSLEMPENSSDAMG
jgi:hypothetical protein